MAEYKHHANQPEASAADRQEDSDSDWDSLGEEDAEDSSHTNNTSAAAPTTAVPPSIARLAFELRTGAYKNRPAESQPRPAPESRLESANQPSEEPPPRSPGALKSNNPFLRPRNNSSTSPFRGTGGADDSSPGSIQEDPFAPHQVIPEAPSGPPPPPPPPPQSQQLQLSDDMSNLSLLQNEFNPDSPPQTKPLPPVPSAEKPPSPSIPRKALPKQASSGSLNPWAEETSKDGQSDPGLGVQPSEAQSQSSSLPLQASPDSKVAAKPSELDVQTKRKEHYHVKHVTWSDPQSKREARRSPILIQNANGPCPLLALVNSLVLTTPAGLDTPLVEALRSREQISLGLLLDAVFDELTSGRRGDTLPNVSDLYAFLVTLHTGMNVNPRFVPSAQASDGISTSATAGQFEETEELKLYGAFGIPLIHGWLASPGSSGFTALSRSAPTYEEAANLQFREEELERKLSDQGLSVEEQQLYSDLILIKQFLLQWPTQLSTYGLQRVSNTLQEGQIAILFRNDHFSTIYKNPHSGILMTLVTDAGYATHDDVVWESLVDVSGRDCELLSGEFCPVSSEGRDFRQSSIAAPRHQRTFSNRQGSMSSFNGGSPNNALRRTGTVANARQETGTIVNQTPTMNVPNTSIDAVSPPPKSSEQEDADLALALQMQEEEEEMHRRQQAEARNRRDIEASEAFINSEQPNRNANSNLPAPRGVANNRSAPSTPAPAPAPITAPNNPPRPPADSRREDDDGLPTYEQAKNDRVVNPNNPNSFAGPSGSSPANGVVSNPGVQIQPGLVGPPTGRRRGRSEQWQPATDPFSTRRIATGASGPPSTINPREDKCSIM